MLNVLPPCTRKSFSGVKLSRVEGWIGKCMCDIVIYLLNFLEQIMNVVVSSRPGFACGVLEREVLRKPQNMYLTLVLMDRRYHYPSSRLTIS